MTQKDILLELLFKFFTFFCKKNPQIHKKNCTLEKWSEGKLTDFSSVSLLLKTSTHILTLLITQVFRLLLFGSLLLIFVCELPII